MSKDAIKYEYNCNMSKITLYNKKDMSTITRV